MLHDFQKFFMNGIYNKKHADSAYAFIQSTDTQTTEKILSIYRGSIYGGLKKSLAETYPVVKELVGEEFFNAMLSEYINAYPCRVQDLNDYGFELSSFINDFKPAESVEYLADIASLEWHTNIATNTELQINNLADIANLNEDEQLKLIMCLPKGSALIYSDYSIDEIWNVHQQDDKATFEIENSGFHYFVFNYDNNIKIDRLSLEQFYFLSEINKEQFFVNVCEKISEKYPNIDINNLFSDAIKNSWLISFI